MGCSVGSCSGSSCVCCWSSGFSWASSVGFDSSFDSSVACGCPSSTCCLSSVLGEDSFVSLAVEASEPDVFLFAFFFCFCSCATCSI